jgi:phosphate:Na+ symporter
MILTQILAGIALTVFGVRFLRKGFDRLFGSKLAVWLDRLTTSRPKAWLGGILVGTVAPSSTGLSLVTMQFLQAGKLTADRMFAVLLGAGAGITITVQLLAFRIQDYAGLFLIVGLIGFQFLRREVLRGIGQCLLALGFVFLAMQMIGAGAREAVAHENLALFIKMLEGAPVLVFAATAVMAMLLQSSTATIGLGLALGGAGLLSAPVLVPWVIGTNVGIACTSMVLGWPQLEGRRLGAANVCLKILVGLPLVILPVFGLWVYELMPGSLERQTAMLHTCFNLAAGITGIVIATPLLRLVRLMVAPSNPADLPRAESFLDEQSLDSPSAGLASATRETLLMGDEVRIMLDHFRQAFESQSVELAKRIQRTDDRIDQLNYRLREYLSQIADGNHEERHWQLTLNSFSNELESIGDIIDKQLCDLVVGHKGDIASLPTEEQATLAELHRRVRERLQAALQLLTHRDPRNARSFLTGKEELNEWCREQQRLHYERLARTPNPAVAGSAYFLDLVNGYRRINSHLSTLGYAFRTGANGKSRKSSPKES